MAQLAVRLNRIRRASRRSISPELVVQMRQAIEELRASKAMTRVLREGHEAPPFALLDTRGERVRLEDLLEQSRAVVLNFFRGHW